MDELNCKGQCEEISYFETGKEMCCQWDGTTCHLHFGWNAEVGDDPNTTFQFVKNYESFNNKKGNVDHGNSTDIETFETQEEEIPPFYPYG